MGGKAGEEDVSKKMGGMSSFKDKWKEKTGPECLNKGRKL